MKVWRKALVYSLPVWVVLIIDTSVFWARLETGLLADWIYGPGFILQLLSNPTWGGMHNYSMYTICALNCLFYHFVVWIIVYLVQRRRMRRSARSVSGCDEVIGRQSVKVWRKAFVYSLPVWGFLIIDTFVSWALLKINPVAGWIHLPGFVLSGLSDPTWTDLHDYGLYTVCALNCLFYHLVVWIIVYLVQRRRTRRSARSG